MALCEGNPPVTGGFPSQRPVVRSFDVFFDLRLNKWLSKQSRRQGFETQSRSLWRHCNGHLYFRRKLAQAIADLHSVDVERLTLFDERGNIIKANDKLHFLQNACSDKILSRAADRVAGDEKNKRYVMAWISNHALYV